MLAFFWVKAAAGLVFLKKLKQNSNLVNDANVRRDGMHVSARLTKIWVGSLTPGLPFESPILEDLGNGGNPGPERGA